MTSVPKDLLYTRDHEWVAKQDGTLTVGISSYAVEQLGDIVHIDLPSRGDSFEKGDSFGTVESTKTVSDLYTPVTGEVVEINEKITESPEEIAKDPYKIGWLIKVKSKGELDEDLMDAQTYEDYLQKN
jgi:glycine cleavage system H protein